MEIIKDLKEQHTHTHTSRPTPVFLQAFFFGGEIWWSHPRKWYFDLTVLLRSYPSSGQKMEDDAIGLKLLEVFECLPLLDRVTFSGIGVWIPLVFLVVVWKTGRACGFQNPVKRMGWGNYCTGKECKRMRWHPWIVLWRSFLAPASNGLQHQSGCDDLHTFIHRGLRILGCNWVVPSGYKLNSNSTGGSMHFTVVGLGGSLVAGCKRIRQATVHVLLLHHFTKSVLFRMRSFFTIPTTQSAGDIVPSTPPMFFDPFDHVLLLYYYSYHLPRNFVQCSW